MWDSALRHVAIRGKHYRGLNVVTISNPEGTFPYRESGHGLCARVAAIPRVPSIEGELLNIDWWKQQHSCQWSVGNYPSIYICKHPGCLHKQHVAHERWENISITVNVSKVSPRNGSLVIICSLLLNSVHWSTVCVCLHMCIQMCFDWLRGQTQFFIKLY